MRGRSRTSAVADDEYLSVFIIGTLEFEDQFGNFSLIHLRNQPTQSIQIISGKPGCHLILSLSFILPDYHSIKMILLPCGSNRKGMGFSSGKAWHISA